MADIKGFGTNCSRIDSSHLSTKLISFRRLRTRVEIFCLASLSKPILAITITSKPDLIRGSFCFKASLKALFILLRKLALWKILVGTTNPKRLFSRWFGLNLKDKNLLFTDFPFLKMRSKSVFFTSRYCFGNIFF